MAKAEFNSVEEYIAAQPEGARLVLERVRATIRKAVPAAHESISYQMPTYKLAGGPVIYFAGWKKHYSLYPASALVTETFGSELAAYEVVKGTIRLPLSEPVPAKLIAGIAKLRAKEVVDGAKAQATAKKKR